MFGFVIFIFFSLSPNCVSKFLIFIFWDNHLKCKNLKVIYKTIAFLLKKNLLIQTYKHKFTIKIKKDETIPEEEKYLY